MRFKLFWKLGGLYYNSTVMDQASIRKHMKPYRPFPHNKSGTFPRFAKALGVPTQLRKDPEPVCS